MTDLQDALDKYDKTGSAYGNVRLFVEAARRVANLQTIVNEQAEDEGLWFHAITAPEAYLQQELRRLHAALGITEDE